MITFNEYSLYANLDSSFDNIALVESLIDSTTSEIENILNTPILTTTKIRTFKVENLNKDYIYIPTYNVASITSLQYKKDTFDSLETIASGDRNLGYINGCYELRLRNGVKVGYYILTAVEGVAVKDVPKDLKQVCVEMVNYKYKQSMAGDSLLGISSVSNSIPNNVTATGLIDLTPAWRKTLYKYKQFNVSA